MRKKCKSVVFVISKPNLASGLQIIDKSQGCWLKRGDAVNALMNLQVGVTGKILYPDGQCLVEALEIQETVC